MLGSFIKEHNKSRLLLYLFSKIYRYNMNNIIAINNSVRQSWRHSHLHLHKS